MCQTFRFLLFGFLLPFDIRHFVRLLLRDYFIFHSHRWVLHGLLFDLLWFVRFYWRLLLDWHLEAELWRTLIFNLDERRDISMTPLCLLLQASICIERVRSFGLMRCRTSFWCSSLSGFWLQRWSPWDAGSLFFVQCTTLALSCLHSWWYG